MNMTIPSAQAAKDAVAGALIQAQRRRTAVSGQSIVVRKVMMFSVTSTSIVERHVLKKRSMIPVTETDRRDAQHSPRAQSMMIPSVQLVKGAVYSQLLPKYTPTVSKSNTAEPEVTIGSRVSTTSVQKMNHAQTTNTGASLNKDALMITVIDTPSC